MKFSPMRAAANVHARASKGTPAADKAIRRVHDAVAATLARVDFIGHVLIAGLSGGSDSVALLHALRAVKDDFGFALVAAHFNHRMRGHESSRDEHFVRELCARFDVELETGYGQGLWGADLEERARQQRHAFFERTARRYRARYIALGHHLDDQAETVLMRLMRGSGIAGLSAMAEIAPRPLPAPSLVCADGTGAAAFKGSPAGASEIHRIQGLVRPLLGLRRLELIDYLAAIDADYVTDGSNLSLVPTRNRIRHRLLPMLERDYACGLGPRLSQIADEMRAVNSLVSGLAREAVAARLIPTRPDDCASDVWLDLKDFSRLHEALRPAVIREFVSMRVGSLRHFGRAHIVAILDLCMKGPANGRVDLPLGWLARRHYQRLEIRRGGAEDIENPAPTFAVSLPRQGDLLIMEACFCFRASIVNDEDWRPASLFDAAFDEERLRGDLIVRSFKPGDRVRPLNLGGRRKIKDVFIEHKLPPRRRLSWPIVASGGEVLWIPGMLRAEAALVGPRTRSVLQVRAKPLAQARNVSLPGI
ncbi:MAG: tRNA lysidine(34) synthetase TilS [Candidatus Binataceae bacterium]